MPISTALHVPLPVHLNFYVLEATDLPRSRACDVEGLCLLRVANLRRLQVRLKVRLPCAEEIDLVDTALDAVEEAHVGHVDLRRPGEEDGHVAIAEEVAYVRICEVGVCLCECQDSTCVVLVGEGLVGWFFFF